MEAQKILLSLHDMQVVLVVEVAHVSGVEPALVVLHALRFIRIGVVAIPHLAIVHQDLTRLSVSQTSAGFVQYLNPTPGTILPTDDGFATPIFAATPPHSVKA